MEKFNFLVRQARSYFETADHLIYVTYPVVGETKMLFVVVENLYRSATKAIGAILHYERLYKRVMIVPDEWSGRLDLFEKIAPRYRVSSSVVKVVRELWELMQKYQKSPMTFSRGEKFVITGEKFSVKTLDVNLLKKYVLEIRTLLQAVEALKR